MKIKLLVTGGSIDKTYNEISERMVLKDSHMKYMLDRSRNRLNVSIEELMMIDSLDMKDYQRKQILEACKNDSAKNIIISHGTSTVTDTAKLLGENIKDKTIVLFGAMIPIGIQGSDALFNLGCALTAVQTLEPGVYITMNGKIFSWDNVMKNTTLGEFQEVD